MIFNMLPCSYIVWSTEPVVYFPRSLVEIMFSTSLRPKEEVGRVKAAPVTRLSQYSCTEAINKTSLASVLQGSWSLSIFLSLSEKARGFMVAMLK